MQIRHLQYFAEIIKDGSISKAAKKLFISPQALSSIIASLEGELGYPILVRTSHGVSPTEGGEKIYNDLQTIFPLVESWMEYDYEDSVVSIDLYVSLAMAASMSRFLVKLEKEHPEISVSLHSERGKGILEKVLKNPHSMAICSLIDEMYEKHTKALEEKNYHMIKLSDDSFGIVLGANYFPEKTGSLSLAECKDMSFVYSSDSNDIISKKYLKYFGNHLKSKVENHASILCMVALNQGTIFLPEKAVKCEPMYQTGMIRVLPINERKEKTTHYLLAMKDEFLSEKEQCLKKMLYEYYSSDEWYK